MRRFFFFLILFLTSVAYAGPALVTDPQNRHNLSKYSASSVKAVYEKQICIFCHTPHNSLSDAPLWNHSITSETNYIHYYGSGMNAYSSAATAPEIDGYSRLCLSCHDGTVALGEVRNRITSYGETPPKTTIAMEEVPGIVASGKLIGGRGFIGVNLHAHPISIVYDDALAIADGHLFFPSTFTDADVKLYPTGAGKGVQCTSCHDPHDDSKSNDLPFWRKVPPETDVCDVCHNM
jgi:hypothetical protein